jgi:hypothetical protein
VFDSEDVIFAWAIGKALLIVIVSVSALVYIAWVATRKKEIVARVGIPENRALRSSAVNASKVLIGPGRTGAAEGARHILSGTSSEENNTREPEQPTVAAFSVCREHPLARSAHSVIQMTRDKPDG